MSDLSEVEALLAEARRLSRQSSFGRRAPTDDALSILLDVVARLEARTAAQADDAPAWLLLSRAHEYLVDYAAAISCLERYMALTGRSRETLKKKLAGLQSGRKFWDDLGLNATQLKSLGNYLDRNQDRLGAQPGDLAVTREWLSQNGHDTAALLARLAHFGAYSHAQVLWNVVAS